jgi:serine/threonine protein kinase
MDFGAGRTLDREALEDAAITGTPLNLAPEVLDGHRATVQSDIYSLGVLLFFLLTGTYPVSGPTIGGSVRTVLRDATPNGSVFGALMMPVDWSPDGVSVLVLRSHAIEAHDVALVNTQRLLIERLESKFPAPALGTPTTMIVLGRRTSSSVSGNGKRSAPPERDRANDHSRRVGVKHL